MVLVSASIRAKPSGVQAQMLPNPAAMPSQDPPGSEMRACSAPDSGSSRTTAGSSSSGARTHSESSSRAGQSGEVSTETSKVATSSRLTLGGPLGEGAAESDGGGSDALGDASGLWLAAGDAHAAAMTTRTSKAPRAGAV